MFKDNNTIKLEAELPEVEGIVTIRHQNAQRFILGDNMALLRWIKQEMLFGYFHVGIVDPPYGISVGDMNLGATKNSKPRNFEMGKWDNAVPTQEYWDLLRYACRNIICWGGNYFTKELDWAGRCYIVWDKLNPNMSFAPSELALTTFDRNPIHIPCARNKSADEENEKRHPTQKPVYLYDKLHLDFVERGHKVLDTHGGSFNHAIAAFKNNVELTIIEREKSYFKSGLEAYAAAAIKPRLLFS